MSNIEFEKVSQDAMLTPQFLSKQSLALTERFPVFDAKLGHFIYPVPTPKIEPPSDSELDKHGFLHYDEVLRRNAVSFEGISYFKIEPPVNPLRKWSAGSGKLILSVLTPFSVEIDKKKLLIIPERASATEIFVILHKKENEFSSTSSLFYGQTVLDPRTKNPYARPGHGRYENYITREFSEYDYENFCVILNRAEDFTIFRLNKLMREFNS